MGRGARGRSSAQGPGAGVPWQRLGVWGSRGNCLRAGAGGLVAGGLGKNSWRQLGAGSALKAGARARAMGAGLMTWGWRLRMGTQAGDRRSMQRLALGSWMQGLMTGLAPGSRGWEWAGGSRPKGSGAWTRDGGSGRGSALTAGARARVMKARAHDRVRAQLERVDICWRVSSQGLGAWTRGGGAGRGSALKAGARARVMEAGAHDGARRSGRGSGHGGGRGSGQVVGAGCRPIARSAYVRYPRESGGSAGSSGSGAMPPPG